MASAIITELFSYFQDLNLLALLEDLRAGRTTRDAWLSGSLLCPVAHGLPAGHLVQNLNALGQSASFGFGCDFAGRQLGADPRRIAEFVKSWDEGRLGSDWLIGQLEEIWNERLEDAETIQDLLQEPSAAIEETAGRAARIS